MKELHHYIFSKSTCISKETMLKYINKQLSKEELHVVEMHMLNCAFCAEALEGIAHAKDSSILFAIDNEIDKKAKTSKGFNYRPLMMAASLALLIVSTFFIANIYNKSIKHNTSTVAVTPVEKLNSSIEPMAEEQPNTAQEQKETEPAERFIAPTPVKIETVDDQEIVELTLNDKELDVEIKELEEEETPVMADDVEQDFDQNYKDVFGGSAPNIEKELPNTKQTTTRNENKRKDKSPSRLKAKKASSPNFASAESVEELPQINISSNNYIHGFKVVDYLDEYQQAYELEKNAEGSSLSPSYDSKKQKEEAEDEFNTHFQELTYKQVLKKAMLDYKEKRYLDAVKNFKVILKKHPKDLNALFYSGQSYYHLSEYKKAYAFFSLVEKDGSQTFYQEAKWYKALTLINQNQISDAKSVLKQIIKENGFYKQQAKSKLKEIK